jgi:type II secretory pathway pseudopilin PulG
MSTVRRSSNRPGIALTLSIIAMVVIAALVTGIMMSVQTETRTGEAQRKMNQAFAVADAAAGEVVALWQTAGYNNMTNGTSQNVSGSAPNGTGTYTGTVTRVNSELFFVDITGKDRVSAAKQRVGIMVKLRRLTFDANAAVTTRGPGKIGGSTEINGNDTNPWTSCPAAGPPKPGIRHPNTSQLNFIGGCSDESCVTGSSPEVYNDPTVNDNTFFSYGDFDWAQLSTMANHVLTGATWNGIGPTTTGSPVICNVGYNKNWGEPRESGSPVTQCQSYFPTIYFNGNTKINGGIGQGIIMVNGDLEITGGFEYYGIVLVRGSLKSTGTGGHVTGGILAANVDLEQEDILGNAVFTYSSCALSKVQNGGAAGAQMRSRGWVQLIQ